MTLYPLTLLYDESCPLCRLEINNLKSRNDKMLLAFVDVSAEDFDVERYGIPVPALMNVIHAVRADGQMVRGVEVFRLAYGAVGLGWIMRPTGWPLLAPLADRAYVWLAEHRQPVSRFFGPLLTGIASRRANKRAQACKEDNCQI